MLNPLLQEREQGFLPYEGRIKGGVRVVPWFAQAEEPSEASSDATKNFTSPLPFRVN